MVGRTGEANEKGYYEGVVYMPCTEENGFVPALPKEKVDTLPRIDYQSSGRLIPGLPNDRIAMRAEGTIRLPGGAYEMSVISDDGVRVRNNFV